MNNPIELELPKANFESDDFWVISMLTKIQIGDEVDNEDFTLFLKKGWEMIRNLQKLLA